MRRRTCISFFVLSVLSAALCISSCDRMELMPQRPQSDEGKTVTLRVIVPEPVVVDPMTRAGAGDFDKIRDLNIVAADGGSDDSALFEVYYADGSQNGDPAVEMEEGKDITIHFSEEFTGRYGLTRKKFYIVANYGRKIDKAAVTTVGLLKALKQESSEGFPGIPVNGCMMFAEAGHAGTHTHPDTGQTGLSLSAELRRTVAMITVGIDGSRLAAGVSIVPRRISLHRVPVQCYLGMANKPYEDETLGIEEIGEQKGDGGELNLSSAPAVVLVIGVNGVGKTTTIGKLAHQLHDQGKKVLLCAGDTFRAAAADQLEIWSERAHCDIIRQHEGADPASVVFDAIAAARARGSDVIICDTAGRLHNKQNLMNELNKISRILDRELPGASKEVLLVLDGTTGQNGLLQAKQFQECAGVTGMVLTKLDGTAKGGCVVAVKQRLGLPVRFIGVGEGIDDLIPFTPEGFVEELLPREWKH